MVPSTQFGATTRALTASFLCLQAACSAGNADVQEHPALPGVPAAAVEVVSVVELPTEASTGPLAVEPVDSGYLLLQDNPRHLLFVQQGRLPKVLVRPGRGPNELSPGARWLIRIGDTIYLPDPAASRIVRVTKDGSFLEQLPLPPLLGQPLGFVSASDRLLEVSRPLSTGPSGPAFTHDITVRDITTSPITTLTLTLGSTQAPGKAELWTSPPQVVAASGQEGLLVGSPQDATLREFNLRGEVVRTVALKVKDLPIGRDTARWLVRHTLHRIQPSARDMVLDRMLQQFDLPTRYPSLTRLSPGSGNGLLVQMPLVAAEMLADTLRTVDADDIGSRVWAHVNDRGDPLCYIRLPLAAQLWTRAGDTVVVGLDSSGRGFVQRLVLRC
jgi:hypothetical protein